MNKGQRFYTALVEAKGEENMWEAMDAIDRKVYEHAEELYASPASPPVLSAVS